MTYLHTFAAITSATISFIPAPITDANRDAVNTQPGVALTGEITPIEPLPELPDTDIIEGVRIVDGTTEDTDRIESALQRFEDAGWQLDNLEIRVGDEDGCGGNAGVRPIEKGHDVVDICTDAEFVLLHELAHVWSALYMDEERRQEWLELRGLDSWRDAPYSERGTEQAADIIAFGLLDRWFTPTSITPNDRDSLIDHFTWLFGIEPLHMNKTAVRVAAAPSPPTRRPAHPQPCGRRSAPTQQSPLRQQSTMEPHPLGIASRWRVDSHGGAPGMADTDMRTHGTGSMRVSICTHTRAHRQSHPYSAS